MSQPPPFAVEQVPVSRTLALRHAVLRPHQRPEEAAMAGDDDPATVAFAALDPHGAVLAVGRVHREAPPAAVAELIPPVPSRAAAWRLRGMATRPERRRAGLGAAVLQAVVDHVAAHGGGLLWCNARIAAGNLYRRAGFDDVGEVWEEPVVGPHVAMWRWVEPRPDPSPGRRAAEPGGACG